MKTLFILMVALLVCQLSNGQLVIYSNFNQQGKKGECAASTIYVGSSIPNGLNDGVKSITLKKGFMATLAENEDGTGEGFSYIASVSDLSVNLAFVLQNKVSFIRALPLPSKEIFKKGAGTKDNDEVSSLNVSWFYDWGLLDESTATREFVPMTWGSGGVTDANINSVIAKNSVTHLLAFNEPDNKGQANITAAAAVPLYKKLLRTGYRLGSPATTESQYRVWLSEFTNFANQDKLRIDFVAVHWYDWGNWLTSLNPSPDPVAVFTRFKNYITAVYNLYQKPIWITEFNANINRTPATHEMFMKLALPWLEQDPRVERYAYFFGQDIPARLGGVLTPAGLVYSNHASTPAYSENIYDKRPVYPDIVSWDTSLQINGGETVSNFSPTFLDASLTAPSGLTRGSGVSLSEAVGNGVWGASAWSTSTAEDGIANKKFLTFSLKTAGERAVSFSVINKFKVRIAANGPTKFQFDYQIDGGEFKTGVTITGTAAVAGDYSLGPIDLSNISELQHVSPSKTITFRITPFAASGTGAFYFGAGPTDTEADLSMAGSFSNLVLGVNQPSNASLLVYPSVTSGNRIDVLFDKVSNEAQMKIFSLDGKLISTHKLAEGIDSKVLETADLNAGIYLIIVENKGNTQSNRFVKQ